MTVPVVMCWSGGKDSALALRRLQLCEDIEVVGLLVTVTREFERVSMHGVRRELVRRQADELQLPLDEVYITRGADNKEYEAAMARMLSSFRDRGVRHVAFGDIFLEDLRQYRVDRLAEVGMETLFPLWNDDTTELFHEFVDEGFRAVSVCVDMKALPGEFLGRELDRQFGDDLPESVDICGENGEFHSFVYDGPNFRNAIEFELGEIVERDGFLFRDLCPRSANIEINIEH